MVLVFLCLGGWLPSHHRRNTCNYGAAPMETRWTWLRAADTQAVREIRSVTERVLSHAPSDPGRSGVTVFDQPARLSPPVRRTGPAVTPPIGRACQLDRHETPDP